jgi:hypothetical protein
MLLYSRVGRTVLYYLVDRGGENQPTPPNFPFARLFLIFAKGLLLLSKRHSVGTGGLD